MSKKIIATVGLGFGDEGKGSIVDFLARIHNADLVIRYNGGSQAAHNVIEPNRRHHCFAQFGSGTLADVETYLHAEMLVDPLRLTAEAEALEKKGIKNPFRRLVIDPQCPIITPFNAIINQMKEIARGNGKHGSCGAGVGETRQDARVLNGLALKAGDLRDQKMMLRKLDFLWRMKLDSAEQIMEENPNNKRLFQRLKRLKNPDYVQLLAKAYQEFVSDSGIRIENGYLKKSESAVKIFEGAQGVLLDENYGFYPYVTRSNTTLKDADSLISLSANGDKVRRMGIIRAYGTRHGAGPFAAEDEDLTEKIPDLHNGTGKWQGNFRIGWLDLVASRYALAVAGKIDSLALTNLDRLSGMEKVRVVSSYEYCGPIIPELDSYFDWEKFGGSRVKINGIKRVNENKSRNDLRSKMLFQCEPLTFLDFKGWRLNGKIKSKKDLPKEAAAYVEFLESPKGLGYPVSIISVGPTWQDKISVS